MRISIFSVGRLKTGPDRLLVERYLERAVHAGRSLSLDVVTREFSESRAGRGEDRMAQEATMLIAALPPGARLVALDEGGRAPTSVEFARKIGRLRDDGLGDLVFAIGGADGHGAALKSRADETLAFGQMTWPHQIVRLLLAEQIYRAMTILSGHPYHRE
ncbi:23S rRNA (pseudouridine(1915)-N(3))-methyltransferase RlmH [Kaistia algarum]|uniref:23S rRNA (pseudouridine(1915)-N(3))-methyltransferase RlmH n=1 Tax=Kaistia algarum TaxID=2083279 RepID=UPI000CE7EF42|nr:23S rRNA (pseudouridine(1915)-N(3))-methyltransferase RlmH [Kaistia algarum]MCX5514095.1 23S rRNA (pseudouridine(1915)-N(3))-methyltransferase RlmH [Kaistia algarum]PPE77330.1 23S rRNA (pseudouridine(1915)-N(3))-methyltransferase RlmH [Kaistia algarum]